MIHHKSTTLSFQAMYLGAFQLLPTGLGFGHLPGTTLTVLKGQL